MTTDKRKHTNQPRTKADVREAQIKALDKDARKLYDRAVQYPYDPRMWVEDFFGDNIRDANQRAGVTITTRTGLTEQQDAALVELGKLLGSKIRKSQGKRLKPEEKEYAAKIGLSIMSGKGTGKDFWSALVSLFFLTVFTDARGLATANTGKQLKNVFWSEIAKVMHLAKRLDPTDPKSPTLLEQLFEWQAEKVFRKEAAGKRWFMEAVTVNPNASSDEQAKALTGRHEDYMIFVIDEAIGVPEPALMALEETMTGKLNIAIMIFNPFKSKGYAIDSQYKNAHKWVALRWNAEDCERVTPESIAHKAEYGLESNPYRVGVLGLPPIADSDTLIPYDWIQDAIDRDLLIEDHHPVIQGGDFGAGGDSSIVATRKGRHFRPFKRNNTQDSNVLIDWVVNCYHGAEADAFFGDVIGIGWAVMGSLKKIIGGHKIRNVDSRAKAKREDKFINRRAENFWTLREWFQESGISIPNDENLIDQLSVLRVTYDSRGRVGIIGKADIKKELKEGGSPDEADAMANTCASDDEVYTKRSREYDDEDDYDRPSHHTGNDNSYMYQ
jgi:hypothetical protein